MSDIDYALVVAYTNGSLRAAWSLAAVPPGFSVQLVVTDGDGQPVPGTVVTYAADGASATVAGPGIVENAALRLSVFARATDSAPQSVTLLDLVPPATPTLDNHAGGILATWGTVAQATAYGVWVKDAAGQPLSPQPPFTCPYNGGATQGWIDGAGLTDGAGYGVQVQASAANSYSDWGPSASVVLDRNQPDGPLLRALLARLKAAGAAFDLGPAIIQADAITQLFDSLLKTRDGSIAVTGAQVDSTWQQVVLTAQAGLLGVDGLTLTFVFTEVSGAEGIGALQLDLTTPFGTQTVAQLYSAGLLPGSVVAPSGWGPQVMPLTGLVLALDSATAALSLTGPASGGGWNLLDLPGVTLAAPQPDIRVATIPGTTGLAYKPRLTTTLTIGSVAIPLYLDMPAGLNGWRFGLNIAAPGVSIGDLSSLDPLTSGGTSLPSDVIAMDQVWLTRLDIAVKPAATAPAAWWFGMGITIGEQGGTGRPVWTIIDGVLAVQSLYADLNWTLYLPDGQTAPTGTAGGTLGGTILVAGHPVDAVIAVPVGPDGWYLGSAAPVPLAGLSDLAAYFGDDTFLPGALAPLGTAQGFALTELNCRFHPPPAASLDAIRLELSVDTWTIPALPWFVANYIVFALDARWPLQADRRVLTVGLSARLTISDQLVVTLDGRYASDDGLMQLTWTGQPLNPTPLSALSSFVTTDQVTQNMPPDLPLGGAFFLNQLGFEYDTRQSYLTTVTLDLAALVAWQLVPDLLVLDGFAVDLQITRSGPAADTVVTGTLSADITLAGADFGLTATRPAGTDPWVLSAALAGDLDVDFSDLLGQFSGGLIVLPPGYGFPTALTLTTAEISLTPSTKAFSFRGEAFVDWSFDFGAGGFAITRLAGQVSLPGGADPAQGSVTGDFAFAGLVGQASLALGSADIHTVVTAAITNAASVTPAAQVDAVAGAGTFASAPRPGDFPVPGFASAGVVLDLTAETYLLHGQFAATGDQPLYAGLALLVQRNAAGDGWGYSFAAGLQNWSFARLSAGLAIVDQILSVASTDAAVALSSLDEDAGAVIAQYIPGIQPGFAVRKGLNLYASLTFGSGLMASVATLLDVAAKGPFTISGYIPADDGASQFTATLGNLTLLHTLSFSNIVLTYTVAQGHSLTLTGDIAVTIPLSQGGAALTFAGNMTLDDTVATFDVAQTQQSVVNPLGIPGITLGGLSLSLTYTFATAAGVPASWQLSVAGATTIGPVGLTGSVVFKDGSAVLVRVALTRPVSIDAIFTQMIGTAWPAGLLDITFRDGGIWYAPNAVTVGGRDWAAGLNASVTCDIYFLSDVILSVQMAETRPSLPGKATGMAQYGHAIDWGFLKLYQDAAHPTLGPSVAFDSLTDIFTVTGGFELFGAAIADVVLNVGAQTTTGTATFPQDLGPFGRPTIHFSWDANGFHIDDWPLAGLQLPDFSFLDIPGSGDCADIVISRLPISSKFNLRPKLSITATPRPALTITLNGSFDLVCNSAAYSGTILTANIVEAVLPVPLPVTGAFDWSALGEAFTECIAGAAQSIFRNLLEDPGNLAKLLAVGGVEFATGKVVSYLVCRGVPEAAAEAFADAAVGAIATEVVIDGIAITVGGVAGSIIGGVFHNGGSSGGGGSGTPRPDAPAAPQLSWANGLKVEWSGVDNASDYIVSYMADDGGWQYGQEGPGGPVTLPVAAGPLYTVSIVAAGPGGVSGPGAESRLQTIAAPANLQASYLDPSVRLIWEAVRGADANGYRATVTHNGAPLSPAPVLSDAGDTGVTLTTTAFEAGGDFAVSVTASSSVMTGPAATTLLAIALLPAVTGLGLHADGRTVVAGWTPVTGASGYRVKVMDAQGQPLSPQPSVQVDAARATAILSGAPLSDGEAITVAVAAYAPGSFGTWSAPAALTITWLPAPAFGVAFDEASRMLIVDFTAVTPATGYEAEILAGDGAPLVPPFVQTLTASPSAFDAARLVAGLTYSMRLRATAPGSLGAWASVPPMDLTALAAPVGVTVTNGPATLDIVFAPVAPANIYEAEVLDASGRPLDPPLAVRGPGSPLAVPAARLGAGTAYGVRVRAIIVSFPPEALRIDEARPIDDALPTDTGA